MLTPRGKYMLVRPEKIQTTSSGVMLLARNGITPSQEQFGHRGEVLAVGDKVEGVSAGDWIRFGEWKYGEYKDEQAGDCYVISWKDVCLVEDCSEQKVS